MTDLRQAPSGSIAHPDYWWYRARSELLRAVLGPEIGRPRRLLDVGSADGPSVEWMKEHGQRFTIDIDIDSLGPGGVCGSALALPFRDEVFDVVAAFDVVEHCEPEAQAMSELARVLVPGGRMFLAVPAYQWAWTPFDVDSGHYRRYTRKRIAAAAMAAGLDVDRTTYIFSATFPMFAADRLLRKVRTAREEPGILPEVAPWLERVLLRLSRWDERRLRKRDLLIGSSVVLVATKPK